MFSERRPTQSDLEVRYIELCNALYEVGLQCDMLDVPAEARSALQSLTAICRSDFDRRFGRTA